MTANLRELFDSLAPALLRYARRLTGSRTDAEEIVQDAFLKLHCELSAGTELTNVRAWLFRVATNAARDRERERRVRAREDAQLVDVKVVDFEARLQSQQMTRRALRRLPPRMRQVLLLWSEGFTYREMADITGIEPGYVGVLLQRARAAFKKQYEQLDTEAGRKRDGLL
jgi:RNA polymerase sigma-70 factor (ECF subfamily)